MSGLTPINGWSTPALSDSPNITTAVNTALTAIDARANPIFSTTTARNAAITSPTEGMEAYVTGTKEKYVYNGTAWVGAKERVVVKPADETLVGPNTTFQNDDDLQISVEANSIYKVFLSVRHRVSVVTADFKFIFTAPASATMVGTWRGNLGANADDTLEEQPGSLLSQVSPTVATNNDYPLWAEGILRTSGTSGTLILQWAQLSAVSANNVVRQDSYLSLLKIG